MSGRAAVGALAVSAAGLVGAVGAAATWVARTPELDGTPTVDLTRHGFARRDVDTPAGRVAVYEAGTGDPVLLLHGVGGGASSYYWHRIGPELARTHRLLAPDWVGFGCSAHPDRPLLFDDYVAQVRALTALADTAPAVVAQSLAAGFTIAAIHAGAPVRRLAMLAPSGGRDFGEDGFGLVARRTLTPLARSPRLGPAAYRVLFHRRSAIEAWFRRQGFRDPAAVPADVIDAGVFSARQPNAAYAALPFLSGDLRYDLAPLLAELPVPGLMLWGSDETQIRPAVRERLERVNLAVPVVRIPDARSNLELEQPWATLAALEPFLTVGASTPPGG
ncbi:alpha/beta fold hydrolase [Micromonospora sp. H33]|uniref:alpha/beta fold hydrolase n=1 Tax=Micromonospora sp. H33 TaxID=3452215 RepID=UPI003F8B669D